MTTSTRTLPTEPGWYYWRIDANHDYEVLRVGKFFNQLKVCVAGRTLIVHSIGGEWGGRVPAPGTTWNVEEYQAWLIYADGFDETYCPRATFINDPVHGIAATTARHRKEQG